MHTAQTLTLGMPALQSNRSTFATNMNEHSSRSHLVLSVYVTCANRYDCREPLVLGCIPVIATLITRVLQ